MAGELNRTAILQAVGIVLRDFPPEVRPTVGRVSAIEYDDNSSLVELVSQDDTWIVHVDARLPLAEQTVIVANRVQDEVLSDPALLGSSWPPCPAHGGRHPLEPTVLDEAWWRCPAEHDLIAKIGRLRDAGMA